MARAARAIKRNGVSAASGSGVGAGQAPSSLIKRCWLRPTPAAAEAFGSIVFVLKQFVFAGKEMRLPQLFFTEMIFERRDEDAGSGLLADAAAGQPCS
jgi:hypothetical protein